MLNEKDIARIALLTALIAALGFLPKFDLASGVPITAQSLGLMLAGLLLGSWRGGLAALLFVVLVAIGLPILSGGRGGIGLFATPSVGFLIGFPFAAFATGWLMERTRGWPLLASAIFSSLLGGIVLLYAFGIPGIAFATELSLGGGAIASSAFILGDLVKVLLAALLVRAIFAARPQWVMPRG